MNENKTIHDKILERLMSIIEDDDTVLESIDIEAEHFERPYKKSDTQGAILNGFFNITLRCYDPKHATKVLTDAERAKVK